MSDRPDQKIRNVALRYIEKNSGQSTDWRFTRIGAAHPEVMERVELQPGELPLVSSFLSPASWYVMTTRRIVGNYFGPKFELSPLDVSDYGVGNFKGFGKREKEIMTLRVKDRPGEWRLEFETGNAALAPIYYLRFWTIKYPVLDKLKG